ncbi:hypothetical protein [Actinomadura alba]|uniref:Uncharacterized protein n=1 Tax=Actinomadura alba TaxID=406431 RepID=A0ABR7LX11_9ACTN|nr:hypothetical protein [Actinomadura alba]MBC6468943.1 hypothetical protein [Actinomadura alba]
MRSRLAAVKSFETLASTADGELDLSEAGLQRPPPRGPTSCDNPFGGMDKRAIKGLIAMFRRCGGR